MCLLWVGEFSGSYHRLRTSSYTFTGFHRWTHMYNQKYRGFHSRGYLSLLATTRHKFSCSMNSGTSLNSVQRIEPTHQPPRMVCDGTMHLHPFYAMSPCICNVYAITYLHHVTYMMNAIWIILSNMHITNASWVIISNMHIISLH